MNNLLVTGYCGSNHITSSDIASYNKATAYEKDGVLSYGVGYFNITVETANTITIGEGDGLIQGHHVRIAQGNTESLTVSNGIYGTKRVDLVTIRYTKNDETGIENAELHVIEGIQGDTYVVPEYEKDDLFDGGTVRDLPLWEIYYNGVSIVDTNRAFLPLPNLREVRDMVVGHRDQLIELSAEIAENKETIEESKKSLKNKGSVSDALSNTTELGVYQYGMNTTNAPSTTQGAILSLPFYTGGGELYNTFRLAIDFEGKIYTSVYKPGSSYGTWTEK